MLSSPIHGKGLKELKIKNAFIKVKVQDFQIGCLTKLDIFYAFLGFKYHKANHTLNSVLFLFYCM